MPVCRCKHCGSPKRKARRMSLARMIEFFFQFFLIDSGKVAKVAKVPIADICELCATHHKIVCSGKRMFGNFAKGGPIFGYHITSSESGENGTHEHKILMQNLPEFYEQ